MHFSIPDTEDLKDEKGSTYKVFNVHINGVLHCMVRYSQMHDLNEQMKQQFGSRFVPAFPPKRFLQVKGIDLEERKQKLERYIQEVSQDPKLSVSDTFVNFLCRAQQETQREETIPIAFDVYKTNGSKISVDIQSTDKADDVLEKVIGILGVSPSLTYYFGLFLVKYESNCFSSIIRKLQEFECPYISLKHLKERRSYKVVLRKAYWEQNLDDIVAADNGGFKLLSQQAESDVLAKWTTCTDEELNRLTNLKYKGSVHEYLQLCQSLPNYGYLQFNPCLSNHPRSSSMATVIAGNSELVFKSLSDDDNAAADQSFSVTRMKCWKLSSQFDGQSPPKDEVSDHPLLQFSFEYLFPDGKLAWIYVVSEQAIMMSMCIKSMVDELMRKRRNENIRKPVNRGEASTRAGFKPRDKTTEALFHPSSNNDKESIGAIQKAKESVKRLREKLSQVSLLSKPIDASVPPANPSFQTHFSSPDSNKPSFEAIGDDDL